MENLIKIYLNDNNTIIIPVSELPVFDFTLTDNAEVNYYSIKMRIAKNTGERVKYNYLEEIWKEIQKYPAKEINKIEIIQSDSVVYTMKNVFKIYYQIDFLDTYLGEYIEFNMRKK